MTPVRLEFEIVGSYAVDFDIEDYEDKLDKPWEEMTEDEKINFCIEHLEAEGIDIAERECDYSIEQLEKIIIDGEEHSLLF